MICPVFLRKVLPGKMDVSGKMQPVSDFIFAKDFVISWELELPPSQARQERQ